MITKARRGYFSAVGGQLLFHIMSNLQENSLQILNRHRRDIFFARYHRGLAEQFLAHVRKSGISHRPLKKIIFYPFILVKNSALSFVPFMFLSKVFKASSGFISAICLRNTHMRWKVSLSSKRSSLRVEEDTISIAG